MEISVAVTIWDRHAPAETNVEVPSTFSWWPL